MRVSNNKESVRGIALLAVMFALMVLLFVATAMWESAQFGWDENSLERQRFMARQLAESGVALAMHPKMKSGDPLLHQEYPDGRRFDVYVGTEGGRILVNAIEDQVMADTVRELFILWGLDATKASIAAESLADWIDEDSEVKTSGAENDYYAARGFPSYPSNAPLVSIEQMLLVKGMDEVARQKPDWRSYFTIYGDGMIDVNQAPADLLEALFQSSGDAAQNLVATRKGSDGEMATLDDYVISDLNELVDLLGLGNGAMSRVEEWITLENSIKRIESRAVVGDLTLSLVVLIESGGGGDEKVASFEF
ncbi:MAG: type II secretion system protein GspK [Verrucomicrobiota bacterium]